MGKLTLALKNDDGTWFGVLNSNKDGLAAASFSPSKVKLEKHLRSRNPEGLDLSPTMQSKTALSEMINLYHGKPDDTKINLQWKRVSRFQESVCKVMREIPRGKVTSYGLIAKYLKYGPRAVGTGVAGNPWPLFVPCHRVVPASLEIGNYSIGGHLSLYGCEAKRQLLEREGVKIDGERIDSEAVWTPGKAHQ